MPQWLVKPPQWLKSTPFFGMHLAAFGVLFTSVSAVDWLMCFAFYVVRMFGITGAYHRYFSHRTYKTSRPFQFVLAWVGCSALQKGPLWWAGHHRLHHKHSDTEEDVHSPIAHTVYKAHVGWVMEATNDPIRWDVLNDLKKYPELRWLDRNHWVPGVALAVVTFALSLLTGGNGWGGLFAGFFLSTVLCYHGTFLINSAAHLIGTRRYQTTDASRNNWLLALVTMGEGWHNNHHHYQSSANQGFFWWEVDITFAILRGLKAVGLIWDLRMPPEKMLGTEFRTTKNLAPLPTGVG